MVVALARLGDSRRLPAIMTVTLALGMQRMARRRAIVRRLPAVEALGAVTLICSDKTGTLTRNEMTVQRIVTAERRYAVGGIGYAPRGEVHDEDDRQSPPDGALLQRIGRAARLCNDAQLHGSGDDWRMTGDPTEGALLALAGKLDEPESLPRVDAIPFESEHRFMATLHPFDGGALILTKGAPSAF